MPTDNGNNKMDRIQLRTIQRTMLTLNGLIIPGFFLCIRFDTFLHYIVLVYMIYNLSVFHLSYNVYLMLLFPCIISYLYISLTTMYFCICITFCIYFMYFTCIMHLVYKYCSLYFEIFHKSVLILRFYVIKLIQLTLYLVRVRVGCIVVCIHAQERYYFYFWIYLA